MTRREMKIQKRKEREAEIEEAIKNGRIKRVVYEDKKKKPALPNRLSPFVTSEEEIEDRQETVEKATMVYYRMLGELLPKLSGIEDPRKGKIKHKMKVLLIYGIMMSMYQIGSRRTANRTLSRPIFFENLKAMFPELETIPHADTLARLLEKLEVSEIQECMIELLKSLVRSKKFKNFLHKKHYLIAVDGTQKFSRDYQWAKECLKRHVGGEKRIPQYYCYILEAVLILDNGIVLPVMSEFMENTEDSNTEENKQDCERKGFYRMAWKLKKIFRSTKLTIVADGLYACGPVISKCRKYGWDYMIVLKEDGIPTVWKEALALMKINPENRIECHWGNRKQKYAWANEMEYEYITEKGKRKEILNVVICYETWEEDHSRSSGTVEKKQTRYAWLSSREINHKNVFYRCTKIGRYRWKIENNILTEKHQGYEYEHCFSYSWNAMKGFHYLMKIGHLLNVLALNSELLADKVRELGIRGFIKYLMLACEGSKLDKNKIKEARERKFMWKLELVA